MLSALKTYNKKFLSGKLIELDESGTRLMINSFLTEVLEFIPIEEVKTEYMIRGTYADYIIQTKGVRHFLVEVKSLSLALSEKHLRQAINYGANEGIEWALLTNGKQFDFYKILFNKPIEARKIFSIDLCDTSQLKYCVDILQFIHRESVLDKGLDQLWNKTLALDPTYVAGLLYTQPVIRFIMRVLGRKFRCRFTEDEIMHSINKIVKEEIKIEDIKHVIIRKPKRKNNSESTKGKSIRQNITPPIVSTQTPPTNQVVQSKTTIK